MLLVRHRDREQRIAHICERPDASGYRAVEFPASVERVDFDLHERVDALVIRHDHAWRYPRLRVRVGIPHGDLSEELPSGRVKGTERQFWLPSGSEPDGFPVDTGASNDMHL